MKRLIWKMPEYLHEYNSYDDVKRIVEICKQNGYDISIADARHAWEEHSDNYAASWLILPYKDEDVLAAVLQQCEVLDGNV